MAQTGRLASWLEQLLYNHGQLGAPYLGKRMSSRTENGNTVPVAWTTGHPRLGCLTYPQPDAGSLSRGPQKLSGLGPGCHEGRCQGNEVGDHQDARHQDTDKPDRHD